MRLGRKPAQYTLTLLRRALAMAFHLDQLGPAPGISNDYVQAVENTGTPWGMLGNDKFGDCVEADCGHTLMLRTANTGKIVVPTEQDVLDLYTALTGFNPANPGSDQGTSETACCEYMVSHGFLGHKADAIGTVDPGNLNHVRWCVQLFGSCRLGINLPQSAMDQFDAGQPWEVAGNAAIVGGHDVPIVDYDSDFFYVVTWGRLQAVAPSFVTTYAEEAHSELFFDWVRQQGTAPSGLDLNQLAADLAAVR
jgi:hypothetical protein